MDIRIPYSKKKRYLTGIDWIINTLHHTTRRETGAGNASQIVLELIGEPAVDALRQRLVSFVEHYALVQGHPARDVNLAPYWKIPPPRKTADILRIESSRLSRGASFQEVLAALAGSVDTPFRNEREHMAFHLLTTDHGLSYLAFTFDHRLFDARGAEMFLGLFQREQEQPREGPRHPKIVLTEQAHLSEWKEKFEAGTQVNRKLLELFRTDLKVIPRPCRARRKGFRFHRVHFDDSQTQRLIENAYNHAGYLMLMPYVLAASIRAFHRVFTARQLTGGDYVIPLSVDTRGTAPADAHLFFNHVSFLFVKVKQSDVEDRGLLLDTIKRQIYDQSKSGLPNHISDASHLMRILPLWILGRLSGLPMKGEMGSFCFTYVGETAYGSQRFMGHTVRSLFHMPRVPVPPGLGVFFSKFGGRISAVVSCLHGMLQEEEIAMLAEELRTLAVDPPQR